MRALTLLDIYRDVSSHVIAMYGGVGGDSEGAFLVPSPIDKAAMRVIASTGMGWEHVSCSRPTRCPNWPEMTYIKRLFFRDDETVMQLHPPESEYVNFHQYCLHLWRPLDREIPLPPGYMVGPKEDEITPAMDRQRRLIR